MLRPLDPTQPQPSAGPSTSSSSSSHAASGIPPTASGGAMDFSDEGEISVRSLIRAAFRKHRHTPPEKQSELLDEVWAWGMHPGLRNPSTSAFPHCFLLSTSNPPKGVRVLRMLLEQQYLSQSSSSCITGRLFVWGVGFGLCGVWGYHEVKRYPNCRHGYFIFLRLLQLLQLRFRKCLLHPHIQMA